MIGAIEYLFDKSRKHDRMLLTIRKAWRHQGKVNSKMAVISVLMAGYIIMAEIQSRKQDEKIEKLSSELEELKREKEE